MNTQRTLEELEQAVYEASNNKEGKGVWKIIEKDM